MMKLRTRKRGNTVRRKGRLSRISTIISTALIIGALLYGLPGKLQMEIAAYTDQPIAQALLFFGVVGILGFVLGLPFSIYSTFVIEEKYGFNKMTPQLFVSDNIKGILISSIIGGAFVIRHHLVFSPGSHRHSGCMPGYFSPPSAYSWPCFILPGLCRCSISSNLWKMDL
jgi:hypothetical protein